MLSYSKHAHALVLRNPLSVFPPTSRAPVVTESKLVLLTAGQTNQLRDEVLGQGMAALFGQPADREDSGLVSQGNILLRFGC